MGSRREHLIKVEIIEHDEKGVKEPFYHYYRVYMKNDSPEYNDLDIATFFLNFLSTIDLVEKPYSLYDIDFGEDKKFIENYSLDIFYWRKMFPVDNNHPRQPCEIRTIQSLVDEINRSSGADYSGLIMEIKYNYYHNKPEQKIHVSDLLMYAWISCKNYEFDIVPHTLYTLNYKHEVDTKESIKRFKNISKTINYSVKLNDGQQAIIRKSIKDFQAFSSFTRETLDEKLPLLCNICHGPIHNTENQSFLLFEDSGLIEKEIKNFPNKDVPFSDLEKSEIRHENKYYLTSQYGMEEHYTGMRIKAYHYHCLKD